MFYFDKLATGTVAAGVLYLAAGVAVGARKDKVAVQNKVAELKTSGALLAAAANTKGLVELGGRIHSELDSSSPTVIFKRDDGSLIVEMFAERGFLMVSRQVTIDKVGHIKSAITDPHRKWRPCFKGVPCGGTPL